MDAQTKTLLVVGGGLALLGVGVYFLMKSAPTNAAATSGSVKATLPHNPSFGDPNDSNSIAFACNTCFKLNAIGHPNEAAFWGQKCTAGGGAVPTSAAQQYT
jgi:hypothetical protein